ncbi:Ycf48-like protein precursor [bacterium BMS3Abin03]|nr:Ycf48-like protein precursor [bacterium BMS3Abin03]
MGLKISFLLLISALITFAQEGSYRNNGSQTAINNLQRETSFPSYKIKTNSDFWTVLNPKIPFVRYYSIDFVNPDTGWAVGMNGAIIITTDGGKNWLDRSFPTNTYLIRLDSYNGQVVIISGNDGIILRSSDGGENWEEIESGVTTRLFTVQMMNDTVGWIVGFNGTLLKTIDSGISWQKVTIQGYSELDYLSLEFFDNSTGYILCNNGQILKTNDGGEKWELQITGDTGGLHAIKTFSTERAVTGGSSGKMYYTTNGGDSWIQATTSLPSNVNSIAFADDTLGYAIGTIDNLTHITTDGGITWNWSWNDFGEQFITFVNDSVGYNVGSEMKIFKTIDKGNKWKPLIINGDLADVFFISEQVGWIAAPFAYEESMWAVYKTTDSGENWEYDQSIPYSNLGPPFTILFLDSLNGFIGGPSNKIIKTTDGGNTWIVSNVNGLNNTDGYNNKFFFIDSSTGWAVNTTGGIIKTTDGGINWFAQLNHSSLSSINSIFFHNSLDGWAVGERTFTTTDGGNNWVQKSEFDSKIFYDVYFKSETVGWLLGDSLYFTTDGGDSWESLKNVPVQFRGEFEWVDEEEGYLSGFPFYKTTDGGNTWQDMLNTPEKYFSPFSAPVKGLGYGVRNKGLIMKFDDRIINIKESIEVIPEEFILYQNYPNPFNPTTTINYSLEGTGVITLKVYDILGREVTTLVNENKTAGNYTIKFNAYHLPSGIYFYRLMSGSFSSTKKLLLLK